MKALYAQFAGALGLTFALGACIPPSPEPSPAPERTPASERTPAAQTPVPQVSIPAAGPDPVYDNWMDAPRTPGDWTYRSENGGSLASYGDMQFAMRCDRANGRIILSRTVPNGGAATMTVRTETADRALPAQTIQGQQPMLAASVQARDPLLDAMALTKGRFAVETPGAPNLYIPAWAEVTRVIEDCR